MRPRPANRVRIIGGTCRGRVIRFPEAAGLRPTPDRVRETLFNWLGQALAGKATLELFAGSGALSLEAASRGARVAVAVDRDAAAVAALRANAAMLALAAVEPHRADAEAFLARETRSFDVVFLDPPFAGAPWDRLLPDCARRLGEGGLIYAEAPQPVVPPPELAVVRAARAGRVYYHLLARARPGPDAGG